ncbi:MAG: hypothetical protein VX399_08745 [SAR324 cluster bacterium]|nr:hypothetical protein [SAR324 cluster bacterium]
MSPNLRFSIKSHQEKTQGRNSKNAYQEQGKEIRRENPHRMRKRVKTAAG